MYEMERFIQAAILLLITAVISALTSPWPYACILLAGMLLIIFAVRSLSDKQNGLLFVMQIVVTAVFAMSSGNAFAYLICYECRLHRLKTIQIFFPAAFYGIVQVFVMQSLSLPQILCNVLILLIISAIIRIAEYLITSYISARTQIAQAVSVTAVNEMYEKKLNQELTIKNYLADKNARLEERENISRNIHNSVGHSITAAIMALDAADMLFDTSPDKAREKMNIANERIRTGLSSIRQAVRVLDSESKLIAIGDFISELSAVADSFMMDTTIQIHTDFSAVYNDLMIPHEHTEFLTGALQELLSNGVRHGMADRFTVRLTADSGHIRLNILDNGISDFSVENQRERIENGFGLKKLISYAKKCGGFAMFANESGFQADITLPLMKEDEHE